MALQSSGAISLNDVNVELGFSGTATITMNDTAARTLAGISSGTIKMSDFYGKSYVTSMLATVYYAPRAEMLQHSSLGQSLSPYPGPYCPQSPTGTPPPAITPASPDNKKFLTTYWVAGGGSATVDYFDKNGMYSFVGRFDDRNQLIGANSQIPTAAPSPNLTRVFSPTSIPFITTHYGQPTISPSQSPFAPEVWSMNHYNPPVAANPVVPALPAISCQGWSTMPNSDSLELYNPRNNARGFKNWQYVPSQAPGNPSSVHNFAFLTEPLLSGTPTSFDSGEHSMVVDSLGSDPYSGQPIQTVQFSGWKRSGDTLVMWSGGPKTYLASQGYSTPAQILNPPYITSLLVSPTYDWVNQTKFINIPGAQMGTPTTSASNFYTAAIKLDGSGGLQVYTGTQTQPNIGIGMLGGTNAQGEIVGTPTGGKFILAINPSYLPGGPQYPNLGSWSNTGLMHFTLS